MLWRNPQTLVLTRINVVSKIPSESGVYAIFDTEVCLLVGEAWNLKARLLEMMNVLPYVGEYQVKYDFCPEEERVRRKAELAAVLLHAPSPAEKESRPLPGLSFRSSTHP